MKLTQENMWSQITKGKCSCGKPLEHGQYFCSEECLTAATGDLAEKAREK